MKEETYPTSQRKMTELFIKWQDERMGEILTITCPEGLLECRSFSELDAALLEGRANGSIRINVTPTERI